MNSRISALGPVGHCTSHFKRAMCISCRPSVDVHMGEGGLAHVDACGQGEGGQKRDFCGHHKWMAPFVFRSFVFALLCFAVLCSCFCGVKNVIFCGHHKWMAPFVFRSFVFTLLCFAVLCSCFCVSRFCVRCFQRRPW